MTQRITPGMFPSTQQSGGAAKQIADRRMFDAVLRQELDKKSSQGVEFSKHAITRAEERGIEVTPALLDRLSTTVERAQAKGATNIVAFDSAQAFIINIPHGRVITAMSQEEMKDNIFTNIDGAVIL